MNIKKIYSLDTIHEINGYKVAKWCDDDSFAEFTLGDIDTDHLMYQDAYNDERVHLELKAYAEVENGFYYHQRLEYVAFSFDGQYVGLVIGRDTPWGWECQERYITNYPLYQAMIAYIRAMYIRKPDCVVGETTDLDDLDGRYGLVIDKRHRYNLRREDK